MRKIIKALIETGKRPVIFSRSNKVGQKKEEKKINWRTRPYAEIQIRSHK